MIDGKRFHYGKNLLGYIELPEEVYDGCAGGFDENVMLSLRLKEGLSFAELGAKFPNTDLSGMKKKADLYVRAGLLKKEKERIFFTDAGAVVSNSVIAELLFETGE